MMTQNVRMAYIYLLSTNFYHKGLGIKVRTEICDDEINGHDPNRTTFAGWYEFICKHIRRNSSGRPYGSQS